MSATRVSDEGVTSMKYTDACIRFGSWVTSTSAWAPPSSLNMPSLSEKLRQPHVRGSQARSKRRFGSLSVRCAISLVIVGSWPAVRTWPSSWSMYAGTTLAALRWLIALRAVVRLVRRLLEVGVALELRFFALMSCWISGR